MIVIPSQKVVTVQAIMTNTAMNLISIQNNFVSETLESLMSHAQVPI